MERLIPTFKSYFQITSQLASFNIGGYTLNLKLSVKERMNGKLK